MGPSKWVERRREGAAPDVKEKLGLSYLPDLWQAHAVQRLLRGFNNGCGVDCQKKTSTRGILTKRMREKIRWHLRQIVAFSDFKFFRLLEWGTGARAAIDVIICQLLTPNSFVPTFIQLLFSSVTIIYSA
jgi:hypothetical protein